MKQEVVHKHYVGSAHSFEIITTKDDTAGKYVRPDVTILKTFFINDKININDWQATWEGLKQDAQDLPGVPLVLQEDLQHPKFSVQEMFDRGTIFDYDIDEEKHQIIVYIRITDPSIIERIKSGELQYVSPAVIPRGSESLHKEGTTDVLDRTLPLHLCIVGDPAYGKDAAKMTHLCTGPGEACWHRLKIMTAATQILAADEDCVSRKIAIIKREKPSMSNEQAAAIAYSMCREGTADVSGNGDSGQSTGIKSKLKIHNADGITELEQIPLIKKMIAATNRIASNIEKIKTGAVYHKHEGQEGRWINVQDIDVFVGRHRSISSAMVEQCGCTRLAAEGKISQEKANYHKTDSMTKNCGSCRFWNEKNQSCQVVEGTIEEYHTSDLWQPKE